MRHKSLNRREILGGMSALGVSVGLSHSLMSHSAWADDVTGRLQAIADQKRLIVLWMGGGPSQMDTFDLKPGHANGGEFQETATNVPGLRFSEHLPQLARMADKMAIVRSLNSKEGDHSRGTYYVRTGQRPGAPLPYPAVAATLAKELSPNDPMIPDYVSVLQNTAINPLAYGAGFLGPQHEPLTVGLAADTAEADAVESRMANLRVENLKPTNDVGIERIDRRRALWSMLQDSFDVNTRGGAPKAHNTMYQRSMRLSDSTLSEAFNLDKESMATRQLYGRSSFGQGCLMARRLVERGVPVVEVSLGSNGIGWDTHVDNFKEVKRLSETLDTGWAQLMIDLEERSLLENTTILWMGEFGRTPMINSNAGRDHFPSAYSCVLAGGNIAGGQVYGKTSADGMEVVDQPVGIEQVLATVAKSVGVDPDTENYAGERPIKLVEASAIDMLLS